MWSLCSYMTYDDDDDNNKLKEGMKRGFKSRLQSVGQTLCVCGCVSCL